MGRALLVAALLAAPAAAQVPSFEALLSRAWPFAPYAPRQAPPAQAPDAATQAWLRARLPGLDPGRLAVVPEGEVEAVLDRLVAARATYLDALTSPGLRGARLYFIGAETLAGVEERYRSGTLPIAGTTKDGRPFRMRGVAAGEDKIVMLYDLADGFAFEDGGNEVRISPGGVVTGQILGPGDVAIQGVQGCGCLFLFCGCADIQRMTLAGGSVIVKTSRGTQLRAVKPIRRR